MRKIEQHKQHKQHKQQLEIKLSTSAFRRGSSAFRRGLILQGYSDHLPINVVFNQGQYNAISWNMLADDHLWNNFRNVSGLHLVDQLLVRDFKKETPYLKGNSYHLYVELAKYLYDYHDQDLLDEHSSFITVTPEVLRQFVGYNIQDSRMSRSRKGPAAMLLKRQQIYATRAFLMERFERALFSDEKDVLRQDVQVSLQHALELIYHIKHDQGALRWKNRFDLIKDNTQLCDQLATSDFLCLQECTSPDDVMNLLNKRGSQHKAIVHSVSAHSNDHCALFYDASKFSEVGSPVRGVLNRSKPYIMARLKDKTTGEEFIISSIHHPGGGVHYDLPELLAAQSTLDVEGRCRYYMMGDFNNTAEFYANIDKENKSANKPDSYKMHFPASGGTLAGSDFGNVNQAIDGVVTNDVSDDVSVSVLPLGRISSPAKTPIKCRFASARFFPSVDEQVTSSEAKCVAAVDMSLSKSKRSDAVNLDLLLKKY